jgi:hypothetical protein
MAEQLPDLVKTAQDINRRTPRDFIRVGFLALSEFIPTLNTLFDEFLPDWKAKRLNTFLIELAKSVQRLESRFDQQEANTAEFGLLLEHVAWQITRTTGEEKFKAYRAILLNACLPSASDKLERAYFLDLFDRLQEVHIVVLSLFRDQHAFGLAHGCQPPMNMMASSLSSTIAAYLKPLGISAELSHAAIRDLDTMGILPGLHSSLNAMMSGSGALELSSRLKDFGRRFADFIALPPEVPTST